MPRTTATILFTNHMSLLKSSAFAVVGILLMTTCSTFAQDQFNDPNVGPLPSTGAIQPEQMTEQFSGRSDGQAGPIDPGILTPPANFPEAVNEPMNDWFQWSSWESSAELGINGGSGNSQSFNITSGFDMKRSTDSTDAKIGLKYINNKSNDVLVANNARLNLDWERKFGDGSPWSWFLKNTYLYDDFRPFDLQVTLNSGFGYKFFDSDIQMLKGRVGAGATKEIGGVNNEWIPEALFGLDYRRQLSRKQKLELTVDYFPSWEDFTDYRLITDLSWEYLLDEETNLSLKLNVNDRYDSTPDGAKANDIFYSLLLLWKF